MGRKSGGALQNNFFDSIVLRGMDVGVQSSDSRVAPLPDSLHPGSGLEAAHIAVGIRSLITQHRLSRTATLSVVHSNLGQHSRHQRFPELRLPGGFRIGHRADLGQDAEGQIPGLPGIRSETEFPADFLLPEGAEQLVGVRFGCSVIRQSEPFAFVKIIPEEGKAFIPFSFRLLQNGIHMLAWRLGPLQIKASGCARITQGKAGISPDRGVVGVKKQVLRHQGNLPSIHLLPILPYPPTYAHGQIKPGFVQIRRIEVPLHFWGSLNACAGIRKGTGPSSV
ncbi:hypothetical protein D3C75_827330 [compost metagenome]